MTVMTKMCAAGMHRQLPWSRMCVHVTKCLNSFKRVKRLTPWGDTILSRHEDTRRPDLQSHRFDVLYSIVHFCVCFHVTRVTGLRTLVFALLERVVPAIIASLRRIPAISHCFL